MYHSFKFREDKMNTSGSEIKILAGNASKELAGKIADYIGVPLADCQVGTFSDGEINVNINETVRGCDVFVAASVPYLSAHPAPNIFFRTRQYVCAASKKNVTYKIIHRLCSDIVKT